MKKSTCFHNKTHRSHFTLRNCPVSLSSFFTWFVHVCSSHKPLSSLGSEIRGAIFHWWEYPTAHHTNWWGQIHHTNWWGQIHHTNWQGQIHHNNWWSQIHHNNWWGQIHHTNWWGQIHHNNWWGQIHHNNWWGSGHCAIHKYKFLTMNDRTTYFYAQRFRTSPFQKNFQTQCNCQND